MARRSRGFARHDDALADAPVVRHDESDAALERERPATCRRAPLEHLDDGALGAAAIVAPRDARRRAVAVEHHAHLAVRQEQVVALRVVRHQETEAVAVALTVPTTTGRRSTRQYSLARFTSSSPVARHGAESLGEAPGAPPVADAEQRGERVEPSGFLRLRQLREQQLAARDRLLVALRLLAKARVFLLPSSAGGSWCPRN